MGATVSVACKLPHGLHIQLRKVEKTREGDLSNGVGKVVTLKGANDSDAVAGHGITHGVDKDFFEAWLKQEAEQPFVKNKLVFAQERENSVIAQAKEQEKNITGFEGLDPTKPGAGLKPESYEGMPDALKDK
ncbi:hypothetical protein [Herbaspirillum huttiense]|uniref:Uncharacterized protein n=2 Tax=Herbaspirillum huttiense TaxID=863372 RepID=A0AAJ2H9J2_9BURK|nr:hypothetical protein [Herbaspirillum huttiense]MDR9839452.1 hypothetical protein [Herbaspirillum huttiense]